MKKTVTALIFAGVFAHASASNNLYATAGFPELVGVGYERYDLKFSLGTMPNSTSDFNRRTYSFVFAANHSLVEHKAITVRASVVSSYIYGLKFFQSTRSTAMDNRRDAITIGPRIGVVAGGKRIFGEIGAGLNFYMERTIYGDFMTQTLRISARGIGSFGISVGYIY